MSVEAQGGGGGSATNSQTQRYKRVSGQHHALDSLPGEDPVPILRTLGGPRGRIHVVLIENKRDVMLSISLHVVGQSCLHLQDEADFWNA
jgi:hypothetical protein